MHTDVVSCVPAGFLTPLSFHLISSILSLGPSVLRTHLRVSGHVSPLGEGREFGGGGHGYCDGHAVSRSSEWKLERTGPLGTEVAWDRDRGGRSSRKDRRYEDEERSNLATESVLSLSEVVPVMYWLPATFSPPLSDFHSQSMIITMRTSAIVAFICLAMGVAPSFSLPSISVRSDPSRGSDRGTSQNGSNSGPPIQNGHDVLHYMDPDNPDLDLWVPLSDRDRIPQNMIIIGEGPRNPGWNHPPSNRNPPESSRSSTPVATDEQREANIILNYRGSDPTRTRSGDYFVKAQ
ncbi:hypothetical protein F5148DRAFT_1153527 [Russula earlei]|uniref:Uncharacterized protein n=1 Tax=Russula earlei TaxID=71964 RepID=A0ACC0TTA2_9AGAM|nr:hypothetical protein F5148DRAFT_1153527 [Russula earlei]